MPPVTLTITLTLSADAADLAAFDSKLAALVRGLALLSSADNGMNEMDRINTSHVSHPSHPVSETPPKPPNGPKRRKINPRPPKTPARPLAPEIGPIPAAMQSADGLDASNGIDKSYPSHSSPIDPEADAHPSGRLSFAEFDQLCRAEMKRLSIDRRIPNHKLWNSERNPQLPTMAAVLLRYGVTTLVDLAPKFGLAPPLSTLTNGQHKQKEAPHAPAR